MFLSLTLLLVLFDSTKDNKADVKAIMARFQASGSSTDETSSTPTGRTKQSVQPTLSSGATVQPKKNVLESLSGNAINVAPKPPFVKKEVSEVHEPNKTKALTNKFTYNQDETNTTSKPFNVNKQIVTKALENKVPVQKPPLNKPSLSNSLSDPKPVFPKPPPASPFKPNWVKEESGVGGTPTTTPTPPKIPPLQKKPSSSVLKLRHQNEEQPGANADTGNKPSAVANSTLKPVSNFRTAQNLFNKEDKTAQSDSGGATKSLQASNHSIPPPKPSATKKPSVKKPPITTPQDSHVSGDVPPGLKRNPLPNSLALGAAPAKPNRPPKVDLQNIKRGCEPSDDGKLNLD